VVALNFIDFSPVTAYLSAHQVDRCLFSAFRFSVSPLRLNLTSPHESKVTLMQPDSASDRSYKIEERFGPIALAASVVGLILGVVESLLKAVSLLESNFYITVSVLWILALAFSRYYPKGGLSRLPIARKWIVTLATILFLIAVGVTYYEHHIRVTYPAEHPEIQLSGLVPTVHASALPRPLILTAFYLNEGLSSFEQTTEPLFGDGPAVNTFTYYRGLVAAFKNGKCVGVTGERPMVAAGEVIKKWLATTDKANLVQYFTEPLALGRLAKERGDIFKQVLPSSADLAAIKQRSPEDYEIIKQWLINCVGVYQPVFTVVLKNDGQTAVDVTQVRYEVERVGQVRGIGPGGPVWPEAVYDHTLGHYAGVQTFDLRPVFNIPPGETKAFNLRLRSESREPGLGWYLRIRIVDSIGASVATEKFQLYLNPK
jgi:hypothetical protein